MITYKDALAENFHTKGFATSIEGSTLKIAAGAFHICDEQLTFSFPEVEFDLESDELVPVIYDVYLIDTQGEADASPVHVDRTELEEGVCPGYEGNGKPVHTLMSFYIEAGLTDFSELNILVNSVVKSDEA